MKEVLVAGVTSNVGKTTVTLGLMQAFKNMNLKVQPYKVGPDYVDTSYHSWLCQRPSINLDEFMISNPDTFLGLYLDGLKAADVAVVEGVMGLYDGFGTDKLYCSSAGTAKKLSIPVLLVIDGSATSTSAAAVVKGFIDLEPDLNIVGVLVNRVSSEGHYALIKKAIERYNDITVVGYLPKMPDITLPSRQLGLVPETEITNLSEKIQLVAKKLAETTDMDHLAQLIETDNRDLSQIDDLLASYFDKKGSGLKLAYAKDEAFTFYYPQALALFEKLGVALIPFSPLHDKTLPSADGYYFGGGYSNLFAKDLSANKDMRDAVYRAFEQNYPIVAEGEALMYLGSSLKTADNDYPMVGVFNGHSYPTERMRRFGYATMTFDKDSPVAQSGDSIRGHEFHYSDFESSEDYIAVSKKYRDEALVSEWQSGYLKGNSYASYLQFHLYQNPKIIKMWIQALERSKEEHRP